MYTLEVSATSLGISSTDMRHGDMLIVIGIVLGVMYVNGSLWVVEKKEIIEILCNLIWDLFSGLVILKEIMASWLIWNFALRTVGKG